MVFIWTKVNAHNKLYNNITFVHFSVMSDNCYTVPCYTILYKAHSVYGGRLKLGGNLELNIYSFHGSLVERLHIHILSGERMFNPRQMPYILTWVKINRAHNPHYAPVPTPHHRCIMLNHTTYYRSTAICKVHNVALRYINVFSYPHMWRPLFVFL